MFELLVRPLFNVRVGLIHLLPELLALVDVVWVVELDAAIPAQNRGVLWRRKQFQSIRMTGCLQVLAPRPPHRDMRTARVLTIEIFSRFFLRFLESHHFS